MIQSLRSSLLPFALVGLLFLQGCQKTVSIEPQTNQINPTQDSVDSACSYFYFLWGAHAELSKEYDESLQAYQKALVCDPDSDIIQNKIPLLLIKGGKKDEAISYLHNQLQDNPTSIDDRLVLARLFLQDGRNPEAIELYEQVLELEPGREDILLRLGAIYSQQGDYDQSKNIFRKLLKHNNELYFAHIYLARLYLQTNDPSNAQKHYDQALKLNWSADLIHEFSAFYKVTNQHEETVKLYEELIKHDPYDELAQYGLVEALLTLGKENTAIVHLQEMRIFVKAPHTIDLLIGKIYISQNNTDKASPILESLTNSPVSSEAKFLLALINADINEELSLEYLSGIDNNFLDFENAIFLHIKILTNLDRLNEAINILRTHIKDDKKRVPATFSLLSAVYQNSDDPQKAIKALVDGVTYYPKDVELHFELALSYEQEDLHDQAIENMEKVIALEPNHAEALNFIGYVWADNDENLDSALIYIQKANSLKPESGYIRDSLGWVHYKLGNLELAKSHLEAAANQKTDDPHIYHHLGDVYKDLKNFIGAKKAYQKAIKLTDDDVEIDTIQHKIDTLNDN